MVSLVLGFAVLVAVVVVITRNRSRKREERERPGATPANAIVVRGFDGIDAQLRYLRCRCGADFQVVGEGSNSDGARRLRIVTVECRECSAERRVHFDVTAAFH